MNHLNVFNPFKHKSNCHEDELTRAFLIIVKNVLLIQVCFIDMIREEMVRQDSIPIPPLTDPSASITSINTQITEKNILFESIQGRRLISLIISDDKLFESTNIKHENRGARYDGVILYDPSTVLIIENKPSVENIWLGQLNPNIDNNEITVEPKAVSLSWRAIIKNFSSLIEKNMIFGLERIMVEEFLEFIDMEFSQLNPYTHFSICKDNEYLLNKRCLAIMKQAGLGNVEYHRGWKDYIFIEYDSIKQVALSADFTGEDWNILLEMYPGDTMNQAKSFYNNLDRKAFLKLKDFGWDLICNMHFSFQASNLVGTQVQLSIEDYIDYWVKNRMELKQIGRENFERYFKMLEREGILSANDWEPLRDKIINTRMEKINICPGVGLIYRWSKKDAISLDKGNTFVDDFIVKVKEALTAWGCIKMDI